MQSKNFFVLIFFVLIGCSHPQAYQSNSCPGLALSSSKSSDGPFITQSVWSSLRFNTAKENDINDILIDHDISCLGLDEIYFIVKQTPLDVLLSINPFWTRQTISIYQK